MDVLSAAAQRVEAGPVVQVCGLGAFAGVLMSSHGSWRARALAVTLEGEQYSGDVAGECQALIGSVQENTRV